jgi:tetrapyrrole methylase family protein/MazG family protein
MTNKKVADITPTDHPSFNEFVATIEALRAPDGCPWDQVQTHESIAGNMIEEAYEAVDTIELNDIPHLREELGDVLLQVVLQSQIAADAGEFTIDDVCQEVNEKIIRRHPHVFGEEVAGDANEVLDRWDQVKMAEKEAAEAQAGAAIGLLDSVPKSFPALKQAQKISRKAASAGFEWETVNEVWEKVAEEMNELKEAYAVAPKSANGKVDGSASPEALKQVELEMGDVLFSLVNVARKMGIGAEESLRACCMKFRERWAFMEGAALGQGHSLESLSIEEMEELWQQAKLYEEVRSNTNFPSV